MPLQNEFGELALEDTQAAEQLDVNYLRQFANAYPPRALQYARDASDQMRVIVANSPAVGVNYLTFWNAGTYAGYWVTGGPNSVDARQTLYEMSQQTFNARRARWTVT